MGQLRTTLNGTWDKNVSLKRTAGFALDWVWILMVFYSIVPYARSADIRGSLYTSLLVSLCATVVTMLFVAIIVRRDERFGSNRYVVVGAAVMMTLGSVLTMFSDMSTTTGMLMLGISSIMTGTGSAVLFLAWAELFSSIGGRLALVELSAGVCAGFVAGFVLITVPSFVADLVIVCLPLASVAVFCRLGQPDAETSSEPKQMLSRQTVGLFVKALFGAILLGVIEGFFDVLSGYRTYQVQDIYGTYLFVAGFLAALGVCIVAVFFHRDGIFHTYRFALLLLCLGCLFTPFMGDNNTYSTALVFAGYNCFVVALAVVCIDVSRSFKVGPARTIGLGFFALYGGEAVGSMCAHALESVGVSGYDLAVITLIAVALLFVSHLFLFTEMDLVKLGLGEINRMVPALTDVVVTDVTAEVVDPCSVVVERYGLSPRESDVLPLLLQGRTISRIQETLFISAGTVSTHIRHIYQKTGVENRQGLIDLVEDLLDVVEKAD